MPMSPLMCVALSLTSEGPPAGVAHVGQRKPEPLK